MNLARAFFHASRDKKITRAFCSFTEREREREREKESFCFEDSRARELRKERAFKRKLNHVLTSEDVDGTGAARAEVDAKRQLWE